jgi:hypothetical protein
MFLFGSTKGRAGKGTRLPSQLLFAFTLPFHLQVSMPACQTGI